MAETTKQPDNPRSHRSSGAPRDEMKHQKHQCVIEHGCSSLMECGCESMSPLRHGRRPGRLHQQAIAPDEQQVRETVM